MLDIQILNHLLPVTSNNIMDTLNNIVGSDEDK